MAPAAGSLLLLDLDKFKFVNDTYGHDAGDLILIGTARALEAAAGGPGVLARLHGDEFVVLLPISVPAAAHAALPIHHRVGTTTTILNGDAVRVWPSIGIAAHTGDLSGTLQRG